MLKLLVNTRGARSNDSGKSNLPPAPNLAPRWTFCQIRLMGDARFTNTMRAWPVARSIFDAPFICERSKRADTKLDNVRFQF